MQKCTLANDEIKKIKKGYDQQLRIKQTIYLSTFDQLNHNPNQIKKLKHY